MIFLPVALAVSQEEPSLALRIESAPATLEVNGEWTLAILVNRPSPYDIYIVPPPFPPSMELQMIRMEGRSIQGQRWTSAEYSFLLLEEGNVLLEPFMVSSGEKRAQTGFIELNILPAGGIPASYNPIFRWALPLPDVYSGERGELFLELYDWDRQKQAPAGIFQGRAPRNAILNEALLGGAAARTAAHEAGVYRYAISIIPLDETPVTLASFVFHSGGFSLNVPEITVPVLPPRRTAAPPPPPEPSPPQTNQAANTAAPPPFPQIRQSVFPLVQGTYSRAIAGARHLWESGQHAQALAEIRRAERDSLSGPLVVAARREMEQALGLAYSADETWRPLRIPRIARILAGLLAATAALFIVLAYRKPAIASDSRDSHATENEEPAADVSVTSRRRSGFRAVIMLFFVGLAIALLPFGSAPGNASGRASAHGSTAVLEGTAAYRIPDTQAAVNAQFDEGQFVIIGASTPDWRYVQTPDGRSGWVLRKAVIDY